VGLSTPPPEETNLQPAASPAYRSFPKLRWSDGNGSHEVVLDKRLVVGSSAHAHIRIADRSVSRLHAELEPNDAGVWVRDLESRNGTRIDTLRVKDAMAVDGSAIGFGNVGVHVDFSAAERRMVTAWRFEAFGKLVGGTRVMRELFAQLSRLAPTDGPVLIRGETGTGKELVARALHDASGRSHGPFLVVDCAALPETLLEAELYGHTKGAFTGAAAARLGVFEAAEGGTVFLDEIGEIPINLQPKLLRVLESKVVRRLGESQHRPVDVRFVTATHRDLLGMVSAGQFREDLYFRLAVLPVHVPPLRERIEDVSLLVRHMLPAELHGQLTPAIEARLRSLPWRGNVRELRNVVDRARALGFDEALGLAHDEERRAREGPASSARTPVSSTERTSVPDLAVAATGALPSLANDGALGEEAHVSKAIDPRVYDLVYKDFREQWIDHGEREYIRRRLLKANHNVSAVARDVELARAYIYRLMKKHNL
jgi:transcriptional regulator with GAF, ATPase, and Fis domain